MWKPGRRGGGGVENEVMPFFSFYAFLNTLRCKWLRCCCSKDISSIYMRKTNKLHLYFTVHQGRSLFPLPLKFISFSPFLRQTRVKVIRVPQDKSTTQRGTAPLNLLGLSPDLSDGWEVCQWRGEGGGGVGKGRRGCWGPGVAWLRKIIGLGCTVCFQRQIHKTM